MAGFLDIDATDIKVFAKQLRAVDDKAFKRAATRRLKAVADDAVRSARSAATGMPAESQNAEPLRPILANAVGTQWRTSGPDVGVSVQVNKARMPPGRRGASFVVEDGGRHRVYGGPWVAQEGKHWFRSAVEPYAVKVLAAMSEVVLDLARLGGFSR